MAAAPTPPTAAGTSGGGSGSGPPSRPLPARRAPNPPEGAGRAPLGPGENAGGAGGGGGRGWRRIPGAAAESAARPRPAPRWRPTGCAHARRASTGAGPRGAVLPLVGVARRPASLRSHWPELLGAPPLCGRYHCGGWRPSPRRGALRRKCRPFPMATGWGSALPWRPQAAARRVGRGSRYHGNGAPIAPKSPNSPQIRPKFRPELPESPTLGPNLPEFHPFRPRSSKHPKFTPESHGFTPYPNQSPKVPQKSP